MNAHIFVKVAFLCLVSVVWLSCEDHDDEDWSYEDDLSARASLVGTYQAEDRSFQNGCQFKSSDSGYTGTGYMDFGGNRSLVEWNNVNVAAAGAYTLRFRYANGSWGNRRCSVTVNGSNVDGEVEFGPTSSWSTWGPAAAIRVRLNAGKNKIRVTATTAAGGPNLDKMDVIGNDTITPGLVAKDFVGHYERTPVTNNWHKVDITLESNKLWWKNAAGVRWSLNLANGVLKSGADCPYGVQIIGVVEQPGSVPVKALKFNREVYYKRNDTVGLDPLSYGARNTFLVTMPSGATASWTEMAFLAAVPAGMKVNAKRPSVIAVTPGLFGQTEREFYDNYLDRYKANFVYNIGQSSGYGKAIQIKSSSLDEVTCELARFWRTSGTVVMANRNNYKLSLSASALAGRLVAPLFYYQNNGTPSATMSCLAKLGVKKVVAVGISSSSVTQLENAGIQVTSIGDDRAVISWLKNNGHAVDYFAACNSADRSHGYAPKSSLAAPLLAAARRGAVVALNYPGSQFNDGCLIENTTTSRPRGAAPSADGVWRVGVCTVNGINYNTVLSLEWADFGHNQGNIDLNRDGDYGDSGEFIKRGEIRAFSARNYFIDINPRRLSGKLNKHWADVLFTYPTHDQIKADIQRYVSTLGNPPKYMVMVGLPDVLPVGLVVDTNGKMVTHFTDQFYAQVDNDAFYDIAMGRFLGENASIFTLAASRAITYNNLLNGAWKDRAVAYGNIADKSAIHQQTLRDAGFTTDRIPRWQDIDRTQYSIGVHDDHGWPFGFEPFTGGPIPPVFASTGGCSMGNIIDMIPIPASGGRRSEYKDFGAVQLARTGAIGFNAFSKNASANFGYVRDIYLEAILFDGATLGEAHLKSVNAAMGKFGGRSENVTAPMSYGDPALRIHVPN